MPDSNEITPEVIARATDEAIARADELIDRAVAPDAPRTWSDTVAPLDEATAVLSEAGGRTAFMGYVHPRPEVRDAGHAAEERIDTWRVNVLFRDDLNRAVQEFAATQEAAGLTGERRRLLDFVRRDLRKAGHDLSPEDRETVREISTRLVELGVRFNQNIAEYDDHLTLTPDDLDGLPPDYVSGLSRGDDDPEGTLRVTMAYPEVVPFMENARRRDLRERLGFKFNNRAVEANRPLLAEAVQLRRRVAELFGQPSWAHHQMDDRMAKDPDTVETFYAELRPPLTDKGRAELEVMRRMLVDDTG